MTINLGRETRAGTRLSSIANCQPRPTAAETPMIAIETIGSELQ